MSASVRKAGRTDAFTSTLSLQPFSYNPGGTMSDPVRFETGNAMLLGGLRRHHDFQHGDFGGQWRDFSALGPLPGQLGGARLRRHLRRNCHAMRVYVRGGGCRPGGAPPRAWPDAHRPPRPMRSFAIWAMSMPCRTPGNRRWTGWHTRTMSPPTSRTLSATATNLTQRAAAGRWKSGSPWYRGKPWPEGLRRKWPSQGMSQHGTVRRRAALLSAVRLPPPPLPRHRA